MDQSQVNLSNLVVPEDGILRFRCSNRIVFGDGTLVLEEDGRIFVQGRLTETDAEVVEAMRAFLRGAGVLK